MPVEDNGIHIFEPGVSWGAELAKLKFSVIAASLRTPA